MIKSQKDLHYALTNSLIKNSLDFISNDLAWKIWISARKIVLVQLAEILKEYLKIKFDIRSYY